MLEAITASAVSNEDDIQSPRKRQTLADVTPLADHQKALVPPDMRPAPGTKPILRVAPIARLTRPTNGDGDGNGKDKAPLKTTGTRPHLVVHEAIKRTGTNGMTLPPMREGNGE